MPKRCSLEGRIVDRATGAPLPHAVVGADSVIAEESEKDGRFDLEYVTLPTTFVVQYGWYFERQFPFVAGWCDHELRIEIDKARAIRKPD